MSGSHMLAILAANENASQCKISIRLWYFVKPQLLQRFSLFLVCAKYRKTAGNMISHEYRPTIKAKTLIFRIFMIADYCYENARNECHLKVVIQTKKSLQPTQNYQKQYNLTIKFDFMGCTQAKPKPNNLPELKSQPQTLPYTAPPVPAPAPTNLKPEQPISKLIDHSATGSAVKEASNTLPKISEQPRIQSQPGSAIKEAQVSAQMGSAVQELKNFALNPENQLPSPPKANTASRLHQAIQSDKKQLLQAGQAGQNALKSSGHAPQEYPPKLAQQLLGSSGLKAPIAEEETVPEDSVMNYGQTTIQDPTKIEVSFHV